MPTEPKLMPNELKRCNMITIVSQMTANDSRENGLDVKLGLEWSGVGRWPSPCAGMSLAMATTALSCAMVQIDRSHDHTHEGRQREPLAGRSPRPNPVFHPTPPHRSQCIR